MRRQTSTQIVYRKAQNYIDHNDPEAALKILDSVLKQKNYPAEAAKWAGIAWVLMKNANRGFPYLQEALQANSKDHAVLLALGQGSLELNLPTQAEHYLSQALEVKPNNICTKLRLAEAYRLQQKFDKDFDLLKEVTELQPKEIEAWYYLLQYVTLNDVEDFRVQQLLQLNREEGESLDDRQRALLYSVLGKVHQDLKDFDQAFYFYQKSNQLQKFFRKASKKDPEKLLHLYKGFYSPEQTVKLRQRKDPILTPEIFILGMSRSGKSLVESLLACHPEITAGGESLRFIEQAGKIAAQQSDLLSYLDSSPATYKKDVNAYLQSCTWPDNGRVTNTLPANIQLLAFVGLWFPSAPLIFISRNLEDLGLSVYFKHYKDDLTFSLDLYETGREIALTEALMDFWISVLPNPCVKLRYEDLVQKPAQVSKALYQFLDLDWKAVYFSGLQQQRHLTEHLAPHQSIDAPAPIRNDYIGWSKPYEKFLAPLRKGYQDALAEVEASKNP